MTLAQVTDLRAPCEPDIPYSAYCHLCCRPVHKHCAISNKPLNGECMEGKKDMKDCEDFQNILKYRNELNVPKQTESENHE